MACFQLTNMWRAAVGTRCDQFAIKTSQHGNLMVGFTKNPKSIAVESFNHGPNGYYFYYATGGLYSLLGDQNKSYSTAIYDTNVEFGAKYDKKKGTIIFYKNGVSLGEAYKISKYLKLYPTFDLYNYGCTVEFIKFK
jgi:hypothetical protein